MVQYHNEDNVTCLLNPIQKLLLNLPEGCPLLDDLPVFCCQKNIDIHSHGNIIVDLDKHPEFSAKLSEVGVDLGGKRR